MTLTDQLAAALREAFDEGRAQGSDEATAYEYGARVSLKPGEAFDNVMADWNASSVPAITSLRTALAAYEARPAASDDVEARFDRSTQVALVAEALLKGFWFSDEKQAVRAARAAIAAMAAPAAATEAKG